MNTILINKDKSLEKTIFRPIYEEEHGVDSIQFLVSQEFYENITNCSIMLQVLLPIPDEEHGTEQTGKLRHMEIEPELYEGRYRMVLPISNVLTQKAGLVEFWFLFYDGTEEDNVKLIKTNTCKIHIKPTKISSSIEMPEDESYDVLAVMQNDIRELKANKMDNYFEYNEENATIQFYNNGEPISEPIQLDQEIAWTNWN